MCSICHQTFCPPSCPNAVEVLIGICETCRNNIREGDEHYVDEGNNMFCSDECMRKYYGIKYVEGFYWVYDDSCQRREVTNECFDMKCKYLDDDDGGHICRR